MDHPGRAHEDATALALTWSIFLVSQHRETEQRILNEIELHAGGRPIGADVAGNLAFTRQVIQEAMRLYPPVPVLTRTSRRDWKLGGHDVKAGDTIVVPIYALHRHRQHWADPDCFDPDRFTVIDVSAGDKIPRKGGPGITRSDLLVINKIDLAPLVGASLEVMDRDARKMRKERPFLFTNLKANQGVHDIARFIVEAGGLTPRPLPETIHA